MTTVDTPPTTLSDPTTFKQRWVDGLCAAYSRTVRKAPDAFGVLSNASPRPGKVAVIVGGGCGHYPAFAGLVGPGLADAAVVGDVFTSPSAEQAYRTAKAVDGGAGVVFAYGNYAGDVMHFGLAGRRLAAEGIEARQMIVTDDVASAPAERAADRRGVAGDFFVFKVLGAAAERGDDLDAVMAAGERANEVTRTFGAAFDGCTLPGQTDPLFTVAPGSVELGLGIHGEPGMRTAAAMDAYELADALVDQLLPQVPRIGDGRVAVLLNGLGSTTYEDLFVTYGRVHARLLAAGLTPYRPEVGEFVTSMDMAGLSLTLMPLDDELAALYDAPCETPGFRLPAGGWLASGEVSDAASLTLNVSDSTSSIPALEDTDPDDGGIAAAALTAALAAVTEHEDELGRLDAVAADGDHGQGIVRGMRAAVAAARTAGVSGDTARDVGTALLAAGTALADAAGGASGALFGLLLTETGGRLQPRGDTPVTTAALADAVSAAQAAVTELGGAHPGDKTMVDALDAFTTTLRDRNDDDLTTAWRRAADQARTAAERTADLVPAVGRAARLGDRGRGSADPGATSLGLMLAAAGEEITTRCGKDTR
ncbi:dihydroxyacetone kinase family protein [Actinomycetospora endophytica]|uniref:Dihydroxyacetone kinase family protein n=1 Tax=Actinomycetospora endophytica TaxID=2291215 RepID=A0ABS8PIQ6_9PSEU|nr:dihydroxyacetone kinase family protein [Actinomycetospora endophytica]MCD2198158.1 dihydroxyacetone kinase family protein [Actinomycetospora endophytica]